MNDSNTDETNDIETEPTVRYRRAGGPECENCGAPLWSDPVSCDTCGHLNPDGIAQ